MHSDDVRIAFDEEWYLLAYPDIARAVELGELPSGFAHYLAHGQAEGRKPHAEFEAAWYARAYPAAATEVGSSDPATLERHYRERGRHRGYLPYPQAKRPRNAAQIQSAFGGLWIDLAN